MNVLADWALRWLVVPLLRAVIFAAKIVYKYVFCPMPWAEANDLKPIYSDVVIVRGFKYGTEHSRENGLFLAKRPGSAFANALRSLNPFWSPTMNLDDPSYRIKKDLPAVLFVHGGGWVIPGNEVQTQQLTPYARAGFAVYSVNYPLAPEHVFPQALVSVLKALRWLKVHRGHDRVICLGESAGANLISMAAALVFNKPLMQRFQRDVPHANVSQWSYPVIVRQCLWYGICDQNAFRGKALSKLCERGLDWSIEAYKSPLNAFHNDITIMDLKSELKSCCPTLFITGNKDPIGLQHSSRVACEHFKSIDVPSQILEFDHTHGFVAYPPQIQKWLFGVDVMTGAVPANECILAFLKGGIEPAITCYHS